MKRTCMQICLLFIIMNVTFCAMNKKKEIIGYYPSWKWKIRDNLVTPARIPYQKLTIINYAFFYPLPDGTLAGRDPVGDDLYLKGEKDAATGEYKPGTALVELAHRNGVQVVLSLGGWEDSNNFPEVAASESKRAQFAHSCVENIRTYDFDGIDVDWESPCLAIHKGTPDDKQNFTTLMKVTRDSLDAYGKRTGKHYLLTAAFPATKYGIEQSFEMDQVAGIFDFINVMTYDYNGSWDSLSGHNSPLYAPKSDDPERNIDSTFKLYTETYKMPASKVNLGVPFYGQTYKECTALYGPHKGQDTDHYSEQGCFYYDIVRDMNNFTRYWDDKAKVPYLVSKEWNLFISYDDEESIGYKAQYVLDHEARGLIIWEITGDYLPDGTTPLLDVIYSKFKSFIKK
jgi:chitinase